MKRYLPFVIVTGVALVTLGSGAMLYRAKRPQLMSIPANKVLSGKSNESMMIEYLAMIAAWIGDKDLACEQLAAIRLPPTSISYGQLKLLPFWDPLRGDPRFEKIVASLAPK